MILTGKCREAFLGWSMYTEETFDLTQELFQHALIIDFFDSVGIYTSVLPTYNHFNRFFYAASGIDFKDVVYKVCDGDRTKATTEAIIKANEIFNNRNHD